MSELMFPKGRRQNALGVHLLQRIIGPRFFHTVDQDIYDAKTTFFKHLKLFSLRVSASFLLSSSY